LDSLHPQLTEGESRVVKNGTGMLLMAKAQHSSMKNYRRSAIGKTLKIYYSRRSDFCFIY